MSLLAITAAEVVISKGFDNKPGVNYYDGEIPSMRFRIGAKLYDSRAENNTRWVNITVKAFGDTCERAKKMKLKEGSVITIMGRLDEDRWHDDKSGQDCKEPVIIAEIIEYCNSGGNGKKDNASNGQGQQSGTPQGYQATPAQGAQARALICG